MSIPQFGGSWLPISWPSKLTNFKKSFDFDPSTKSLHGPDHDKRYHFGCVSVSPTKPTKPGAEVFMDRKPVNLKNDIFHEFGPIFGISAVLPLNFDDIFATTDEPKHI